MTDSQKYHRLHNGVKKWIDNQGWDDLRYIQEKAIDPIMDANCDVVISASTAAGKTEAAFMPACSLNSDQGKNGVAVLYISPLKALINDQHRRLESLCEILNVSLTPWHGDVLESVKNKQRTNPGGILLITPESLESLLINKPSWTKKAITNVSHIIIDEFHAFLGTERGCQLLSIMNRLEFLVQRTIPRVALSATLGDIDHVASCLRENGELPCEIIESPDSGPGLKVQLRGYLEPSILVHGKPSAIETIQRDLYDVLRGKSNLIFANSRSRTEEFAAALSDRCAENGVPNEFFPHHGSLSKEIREGLESRLQAENKPTTAVCTMTLELGIDIGAVDSIAQVTAPHSVSSLRQRLGRSGRRNEPAVLRMFILESELTEKSHLVDRLRLQTFQCIAMINLLLKKEYEPAPDDQYNFSTLLQQTLSVVGQYGGVRADQLWVLLCKKGPFKLIDQQLFANFLRVLGDQELITQTHDGQIILGLEGERTVGHFTFYTAFKTPDEFRLECDGRALGTVPIDNPLEIGQLITFAGKRWQILNVNAEKKLITLKISKGGKPPKFGGGSLSVHDMVRREMLKLYTEGKLPPYLDSTANSNCKEGLDYFIELELDKKKVLQSGGAVAVLPWLGDRIINTIAAILRRKGLNANSFSGIIDIDESSIESFYATVDLIIKGPIPTSAELANEVPDTIVDKHDNLLPKEMRDIGYGAKYFDISGAWTWFLGLQR